MTRNEAIEAARDAVALTEERYAYLPKTLEAVEKFIPHEWVIMALMYAVEAERRKKKAPDLAEVPIEPTQEMLDAARIAPIPAVMLDSMSGREDLTMRAKWAAMLGVAF